MTEPSESAKTTAIETDTPSTEDKNIKDANAVNSVENAEKTESTTHTGRGKAIAIAAVVLILIAGVGGYAYWTHFEAAAYHDSVVTAETADTKLTKTIDKATAVTYKADQLKEPKLLDQLDTAIKKVNDSKAAKEKADAEAAAKAQAEAQAQAAAQSQSQSYNRGYSSNRGGNSNSSRGYSAPQQSYAPSDNTNSGSGSHRTFDFSNSGADGGSVGGDPYAPIVH